MDNLDFLSSILDRRRDQSLFRQLGDFSDLVDFSSNDYLGLSSSPELIRNVNSRILENEDLALGSTGSRLVTGNSAATEALENQLSQIFKSNSTLLFNSGYNANQAVLSSVPQRGDTILYDSLSHACIKDGARLSAANSFSFAHNDLDDLARRFKKATGKVFVVVESIYSMDGDSPDVAQLISFCKEKEAYLIVDEAHSTGVYGDVGGGLLVEKGLHEEVFARIYTFGKGMGVHGACVCGDKVLTDYLINFARPFIYTTALPPHAIIAISESFKYLSEHIHLQQELDSRVKNFCDEMEKLGISAISNTHIQPVMIKGNKQCREVAHNLQNEGFDVRPILSPTVPEGSERLRISLHVHNTMEQITDLVGNLKNSMGS